MTNDYLKDLEDWDDESQQILLSLAKNNAFISFEEMEKGVLGKGKIFFEGIRTNKTFREISNEIAIESPFGKQSVFYNYFVTISNPKDKVIKDEKKFYTNFIACKSGSEVFERYNNDQNIADNEMNIYCEEEKTGKSNFFGTACRVRIGKGFREILDRNNFNTFITNFNTTTTSLNDFVSKIAASHEISSSLLEIAIRIEFLEKNELNQAYQQVTKLNNSVADFLQSGVEVLDTYKLTDVNYDYEKYFLNLRNTTAQNYPYKPLLPIKAFMTEQDRMYSENAQNFATSGLKNLTSFLGSYEELVTGIAYYFLKKTKEFSQDVVEAVTFFARQQLEKIIPESIKTIFKRLKNCLNKIVNAIGKSGQLIKNKIGHDLALANAFLCGLVNGLISLIQTILMLLAFVVDNIPLLELEKMTPSALVKHQEKLEFVEDTVDLLEEKISPIVDSIITLVTNIKIWRELTSFLNSLKNKIANLNQYFWAFFAGAVAFEILLEVILAIFTAGSGNVANISSKISRISAKAEQLTKKTANFVTKLTSQVKNSLNQLIKWLRKELEDLIEAIKSGRFVEYVKAKFNQLFGREEEIFDELLDKLGWEGKSASKRKKFLGREYMNNRQMKALEKYIIEILGDVGVVMRRGEDKFLNANGARAGFSPITRELLLRKKFTFYEAFHEIQHALEFKLLGKEAYLEGAAGTFVEQRIRTYKREKWVYDKIMEKKHLFNELELENAEWVFGQAIKKLEKVGIDYKKM